MHYWDFIENYWDEFDIYRQKVYLQQIRTLPPPVVHLLAAHWCQSEVCNGGLHQLFMNCTGIVAPEAVEGFRKINMPKTAAIVSKAASFFPKKDIRSRKKRAVLLDQFMEKSGSDLARLADPFFDLHENFFDLLHTEFSGFDVAASLYAAEAAALMAMLPPR